VDGPLCPLCPLCPLSQSSVQLLMLNWVEDSVFLLPMTVLVTAVHVVLIQMIH
jgi:hypothetical protein